MKNFLRSRDGASKGAALMIVLAFVVLLIGLTLAYFSRATTDRRLAQRSYNDTSSDLLARSALDIIVRDFKRGIIDNPTVSAANIQPSPYGTPSAGQTPIPNLVRRSFSGDPTGVTSNVNSTAVSSNGRSISLARWNNHYLIPLTNSTDSTPVSSFVAPDWVLITAQGPNSAPAPSAVIGRYAFTVYDEGGLVDMSLAGFPTWTSPGGGWGNPPTTPTPWLINVGRKGTVAFADLTALASPSPTTTPSQTLINSIVAWRNYATSGRSGTSFPSSNFQQNDRQGQDALGSYLLDFGDPPYPTPNPVLPFTTVDTSISGGRTDQALVSRQQLLKLQSSLGFSQNLLQYMGTFSRERNQPARDWNRLNNRLPDRYDINMIGMVKPNPNNTANGRGHGQGHGNGDGQFKGRGHYRGDALSIRDLFGLAWVPGQPTLYPPYNVKYWGHWLYVGTPPLPNGNPHIPVLRGGRNDFFQILDYCTGNWANADNDDADPQSVKTILSLGASLFDQYDEDADDLDTLASPQTGTHVTVIAYGNSGDQFVLGWENGEAPAATDTDPTNPHNPYNWITDTGLSTGTRKPLPSFTPIVLNHAFTTVGDLGYGLRTEGNFSRVDFHTAGSTDAPLLDFCTYNPVDHNYPRIGIANLNTKNEPVIAAILQSALKKDVNISPTPSPFPTVAPGEAAAAAHAIVIATTAQPVLTRAEIARLTSVAAAAIGNPGYAGEELEKLPEVVARALSEIGQTRTWNLMIDVITQTGRYTPDATDIGQANKFIVQGEKRYWLHIALGRDLLSGQVDVLGTQLEEVVE
jgi:Tfp pilus assembly protein PilX